MFKLLLLSKHPCLGEPGSGTKFAMTSVLPLLATSVRKDVTRDERGRSPEVVRSLNLTLREEFETLQMSSEAIFRLGWLPRASRIPQEFKKKIYQVVLNFAKRGVSSIKSIQTKKCVCPHSADARKCLI